MGILSKKLRFSMNPLVSIIRRRAYNNLSLLLQRRDADGTDYFTALDTKNFSPKYNLYPPHVETDRKHVESSINSCNGLLSLDYGGGKVLLWNPSTNYHKLLPHTSPYLTPSPTKRQEFLFLATCFGFDPTSNDYKMLRFFVEYNFGDDSGEYPNGDEQKDHIEVYSLKNNFWKDLPNPEHYLPKRRHSSVSINGYYYWSCPTYECMVAHHILCYDSANEEFSILPIPDIGSNSIEGYSFDLLEFDGSLSAVLYPILGIKKCFHVWVMMNGLWVKESTVNLAGAELPLGFWRKGQYMFFQGLNHELMVFDRATGDLNNLCIYSYPYLKNTCKHSPPQRRTMKLFSHLNNALPLSDQA